jgi:hypothetical protein
MFFMKREIYEVTAKVVDASGAYNNLTGYPKSTDSHQNNDDLTKAYNKACADYHDACKSGYTAAASGRPLTIVSLLRVSDGRQLMKEQIGSMPELPDPEPEEEGGEE